MLVNKENAKTSSDHRPPPTNPLILFLCSTSFLWKWIIVHLGGPLSIQNSLSSLLMSEQSPIPQQREMIKKPLALEEG